MGALTDAHVERQPRILVYDIETRPMVSMHWGARDQNISPEQVLDAGGVLCWAAKWLGDRKVMYGGDHTDDHVEHITRLHGLIHAADIVVGYNQVSFDDKRVAVEWKRTGLSAPSPVKSVDLLKAVRARFGFPINKLASVAVELGLGDKLAHTGWRMWRACCTDADGSPYLGPTPVGGGDPGQWRMMARYCRQDVRLTESVYLALREGGWIKGHPPLGLFGGPLDGCQVCGGQLVADGVHPAANRLYGRLRCVGCGAWHTDGKAIPGTATKARPL